MDCQIGNHKADQLVLINLEATGALLACVPCARAKGYFCDRHQIRHFEYSPDGTTCPDCIYEMTEKNLRRGQKFLEKIYAALPPGVTEELNDYFDYNPSAPDMEWRYRRLINELSRRACCRQVSLGAIVEKICREKSIRPIFP